MPSYARGLIQAPNLFWLIIVAVILSLRTDKPMAPGIRQAPFLKGLNLLRATREIQLPLLPSHELVTKSSELISANTSNSSCSTWQCRVNEGKFATGAPYIRVRQVCVGSNTLQFLSSSDENAKSLRYSLKTCCGSSSLQFSECSNFSQISILCQNLLLFDMSVLVANPKYVNPHSPIFLGRTYLLDTAISGRYHYGHAISKFIQLALLNESFDRIVVNRVENSPGGLQYGYNEDNIRNIFDLTVTNLGVPIVFTRSNITCFDDLWMVRDYEQMMFSISAAQQWRSLLTSKLGITYGKCPPGRAFLLTRKEGSLRQIVNVADVEKVASEFGIRHIELVSISSKNTTAEHVRLFSSFGLLISTHSSALKTLVFSNPNAVVIEVGGLFIPDWGKSAFQVGMDFLDIHYIVSRHHGTNLTACGSLCKLPTYDVHAPHIVNTTLLREALQQGLTLQRRACPRLVYN